MKILNYEFDKLNKLETKINNTKVITVQKNESKANNEYLEDNLINLNLIGFDKKSNKSDINDEGIQYKSIQNKTITNDDSQSFTALNNNPNYSETIIIDKAKTENNNTKEKEIKINEEQIKINKKAKVALGLFSTFTILILIAVFIFIII
ncbi:UNVERIFIED_CONTAM: hypothetical protein O8I53_11405 [Campylobacter lari]